MKTMTAKRTWIRLVLLAGILIPVFALITLFHVDYRDYKKFRRAIKSEGFEIQKRWIYEEDFVLEDFGIYTKKADFGFWLDVRSLSNVRSPDSKIEGILFESLHEGWNNNQRVISFDSTLWREEKLPMVTTPREFLAHAHAILPSIYKSKAKLEKFDRAYGRDAYRNFLIIRDDSSDLAPVTDEFVEDAK